MSTPNLSEEPPPAPSDRETVIRLRGVSKQYRLHKQKPFLVREVLGRLVGRAAKPEEFWAVRDVDLDVHRGEAIGLIGQNGAGKSTLLGLVTQTIYPTKGSARIRGRVGSLLELGAGFHPDLTGRENVYLNGSLLGLSRGEVAERFDRILDFSELHQFIDVPLRNYSSGMRVRLGFAVAIHVDPEILIMDEVLAVGDAGFQQKCLARIHAYRETGNTMLFASHNMNHVCRICERALWLDHGIVRAMGPAKDVVEQYLAAFG